MAVWRLDWSKGTGRPVKCLLRAKGHKIGVVARTRLDESLVPQGDKTGKFSSVVAVFEDGSELRVNDISRVQVPVGDSGGLFTDEFA